MFQFLPVDSGTLSQQWNLSQETQKFWLHSNLGLSLLPCDLVFSRCVLWVDTCASSLGQSNEKKCQKHIKLVYRKQRDTCDKFWRQLKGDRAIPLIVGYGMPVATVLIFHFRAIVELFHYGWLLKFTRKRTLEAIFFKLRMRNRVWNGCLKEQTTSTK